MPDPMHDLLRVSLSGWISNEVWRVFLVFARIGTAFAMLPGFGEPGVQARIRILAGLGFSIVISGVVGPVPPSPANAWGILFGLAPEIATGALLGLLSRIMVSGVLSAGVIIGQNIGLSNIFAAGLGLEQSAVVGAAVYAGMIATLFAGEGHHMMLRALLGSYELVGAGVWPDVVSSTRAIVHVTSRSFLLATELSMPFLLLALLFNSSLALVNRVMPSLPVFTLGMPALVMLGLYTLASTASALLNHSLAAYAEF